MSFVSGSRSSPGSVGSVDKLLASSMTHSQEPHQLQFTHGGWDDRNSPTRQWYESQDCTKFTYLQYRKEEVQPFLHEFIVAELEDGTFCRFDRRGDDQTRTDILTSPGLKAQDTAHVFSEQDPAFVELERDSKVLVRLSFREGQDILSILATCYGVQVDDRAKSYTFTQFNCYFMSWTILTAAARRTTDWTKLTRDPKLWEGLVKSSIGRTAPGDGAAKAGRRHFSRGADEAAHTPFIGDAYLVDTLRKALVEARAMISKILKELILYSTVKKVMGEFASECTRKAAVLAAKTHAYRAARDAAMEAHIQTTWMKVLNGPGKSAGAEWEEESKAVMAAVRDASESSANMDLGAGLQGGEWEVAWRVTWVGDAEGLVSLRAKAAWRDAWVKACNANEDYIPKINTGVAEYVLENLPRSTVQDLKIEIKTSKIAAAINFNRAEHTDADLQKFIEERIAKVPLSGKQEIADAMHRVWAAAASLDLNWKTKTGKAVAFLA
ncbi:hypothetical protein BDV93DRAFT_611648 [Ceratobasidium sp. AG-I]|nr:hypothetical protein BDV93DRAFT_611648 [Ceratobasidium sp. AG-I]